MQSLRRSDDVGRRPDKLNLIPAIVLIGLTWSFLQHLCSGMRHFLLDTGAGYELKHQPDRRTGDLRRFDPADRRDLGYRSS
jgi:hypothetical protein